MSRVRALAVGEELTFQGGYRKPFGGHVVMHILMRTSADAYTLTVSNSGNGIAYHGSSFVTVEKEKFRTTISIPNIPVRQGDQPPPLRSGHPCSPFPSR